MTTATALGIRSYKLPWQKCCGSMQVSQWHAIQSSANVNRNYAVCTMHHMLIAAKHNQYCARLIDIVHELFRLGFATRQGDYTITNLRSILRQMLGANRKGTVHDLYSTPDDVIQFLNWRYS